MEKELTIENFAAVILRELCHPNEYHARWLCTSEEVKQECIKLLQQAFERWRNEELFYKQEREKLYDPINICQQEDW